MSFDLLHGDCLDVLRSMEPESVDAVVTDPPYSLGFMGKSWDTHSDGEDSAFGYWLAGFIDGEGCFTVKGHTRGTYAPSFSVKLRRDDKAVLVSAQRYVGAGSIVDVEGQGNSNPQARWAIQDKEGCQRLVDILDKYPLRAKKRIDYLSWREAVCEWTDRPRGNRWAGASDQSRMESLRDRTASAKAYADPPWSGHGFQDWCRLWAAEALRVLKPGGHLLAFGGTRTYHRLACAIEDAGWEIRDCIAYMYGSGFPKSRNIGNGWGTALKPAFEPIVLARKPLRGTVAANVLAHGTGAINVDGCRIESEPAYQENAVTQGINTARTSYEHRQERRKFEPSQSGRWPANVCLDEEAAAMLDAQSGEGNDSGGASRFFYSAKASTAERNAGVDRNHHPTVKPVDLMRWLCRLVTPPGGLVLDPFTGSGSTGIAALREGFRFVGIEREAEYIEIARRRIEEDAPLFRRQVS